MTTDRWEIIEDPTGWAVERNGRSVVTDLLTVADAREFVKKRRGKDPAFRVVDRKEPDPEPKRRGLGRDISQRQVGGRLGGTAPSRSRRRKG